MPKPTLKRAAFQILQDAHGAVVSPETIARQLYGASTPIRQASVRNMIQRIREERRGSVSVVNVFREGYRLVSEVRR